MRRIRDFYFRSFTGRHRRWRRAKDRFIRAGRAHTRDFLPIYGFWMTFGLSYLFLVFPFGYMYGTQEQQDMVEPLMMATVVSSLLLEKFLNLNIYAVATFLHYLWLGIGLVYMARDCIQKKTRHIIQWVIFMPCCIAVAWLL